MNRVRNRKTVHVLITFWCLVLINMSFLSLEVSVLKTLDVQAAEKVSKIISNTPFEEESDHSQGPESKESAKEIDLAVNNTNHGAHENISTALRLRTIHHDCETRPGHTRKYSPPPDQA